MTRRHADHDDRQQVAERALRARATRSSRRSTCRSSGELPAELDGRYLRNGPNPVGDGRPGDVPLVHRRRHGPRRPPARRAGRVVPQPLGALDHGQRGARRGAQAGGAPRRDGRRQHQRHRARRAHVRHRRGRRPARRADRRAGHDRPQRLRRHAAQRLHGPSRRSTRRPARCTPSPTTGRCRTCSTSSSAPTGGSARSSRSRSTAGRWSTTARSPSGGWSSTTCPSRSTSTTRCAAPASRTPGTRAAPPASACCRSAAGAATCAGSRSRPCYVFHPLNAFDDGDARRARRRALRPHVRRQPARSRRVDRRCCGAGRSTRPPGGVDERQL